MADYSSPVSYVSVVVDPVHHASPISAGSLVFRPVNYTSPVFAGNLIFSPPQHTSPVYADLLSFRVPGIRGKQLIATADAVATANLVDGVFAASVAGRGKMATAFFDEATFTDKVAANAMVASRLKLTGETYDFTTAAALRAPTPVAPTDVTSKNYVDSLVNGLNWQSAVSLMYYIGTRTILQIDALTPSAGWTVVAGNAGTPAAGTSSALAAGDLAEFDGTSWIRIVTNSGGFPPSGTRAVVAWPATATLYGPLVDGVDEGKIARWDGTSLTPVSLASPVDGWAVVCRGSTVNPPTAFNENKQFAFAGVVPSGSWNQISGLISYGTPVSVGTANSAGVSTDVSRVDHVHDAPAVSSVDRAQAPTATAGNYASTGITITATPGLDGAVRVSVNGSDYPVGDGNRDNLGDFTNNVACYFSNDGGATARAQSAIVAGDTLYWNGTHVGFDLATTDTIDIDYESF